MPYCVLKLDTATGGYDELQTQGTDKEPTSADPRFDRDFIIKPALDDILEIRCY